MITKQEPHLAITIPAHNEPNLLDCLDSIWECDKPNQPVIVFILINACENQDSLIHNFNNQSFKHCLSWVENHQDQKLVFNVELNNNLPKKTGGVGLARKIIMDYATEHFDSRKIENGVIVGLDADCKVESNYLTAIEKHFKEHPSCLTSSIYFEHEIVGEEFDEAVYRAIANYETHLRYYKNALKFTGHPHFFYTIGSSMAVKSKAYKKQGGMNTRKAGEDFYFLQKMMLLGNYSTINDTVVYPSPRPSNRVPFGTGKAIIDILEKHDYSELYTYTFQSFQDVKFLFVLINEMYELKEKGLLEVHSKLPQSLKSFISSAIFIEKLNEINANSSNLSNFRNRFFSWFNAFQVLKFVHHCRDKFYSNIPVQESSRMLVEEINMTLENMDEDPLINLLMNFRKFDRISID